MLKGSYIISIGFVLFLCLDLISTLRVGELLEYMEANPIYLHFGWVGFAIANLLALYILLRGYCHKQMFTRFLTMVAFVYLSMLRIFVTINNWEIGNEVAAGEITKEMVMGITDAQKVTSYAYLLSLAMLLPLVINIFVYWLFTLDHKMIEKYPNKILR